MIHSIVYQEVKKIFSDTKIIVFIILLILLQVSVFNSAYHNWSNKIGDIKDYNQFADKWNGEIDWTVVDFDIISSLSNDTLEAKQLFDGDLESIWRFEYHCAASRSIAWSEEKLKLETNRENLSDTIYNQMMEHIEEPGYANCSGLNGFNQNILGTVSAFSINILIILVVSPLFAKEKSCNMDAVISSSFLGNGKIAFLKVLSVYFFMSIFIVVYYMCFLLIYLVAFDNWKALHMSLNYIPTLYMTPYKMNIMQYLIFSLLRFWLGTIASVTIACTISMSGKKSIGNIVKNSIVLFIPLALPKFGFIAKLTALFPVFAMQGYFSFSQYIDYKIGNIAITYRWVSICVMVFATILFLCIMFVRGKENEK